MGKYIIELEDNPYMTEDGVNYYACKTAPYFAISDSIISKLTPYPGPDGEAVGDQPDEIHVGDEVFPINPKATRVVTRIHNNVAYQICHDGNAWADHIGDLCKTGRHFEEIENLLTKLNE